MKEKCGLFGILTSDDTFDNLSFVVKGLQYLQHRGEESCGIAYHDGNAYDDGSLNCITGLGLVKEVFQDYIKSELQDQSQNQGQSQGQGQMQMQKHNINKCIGHVRYSTSGKSKLDIDAKKQECQPLYGTCKFGDFYLAHNGNVPGLQEHDTQYIINFIQNSAINASSWIEVLSSLVESIPAAYCLLILTKNELFAVRDRYGIRPLCIGCAGHGPDYGHGYCFASESCALQHYNYVRDVLPGEVISVSKIQLESLYVSPNSSPHICAFECIYFMNENSLCNGYVVRELRERLGAALAMKQKRTVDSDEANTIVVGIPNSGIASAKKYAEVLGIPYVQAIKKNPNIGRTFIASNDTERKKKCKEKFVFVSSEIRGRKLVIVDDTIVRGNVMTAIVASLFEFGAVEVHIRIPAPPVVNICSLGIDIPSQEELIAFQFQKKYSDIAAKLNATSVDYLACEDLDDILQFPTYKECFLSNEDGAGNGNDWLDGLMV